MPSTVVWNRLMLSDQLGRNAIRVMAGARGCKRRRQNNAALASGLAGKPLRGIAITGAIRPAIGKGAGRFMR